MRAGAKLGRSPPLKRSAGLNKKRRRRLLKNSEPYCIRGGPLHQKYRIYLDRVAVAAIPESYEDRLVEMFPCAFTHLHRMALDPYDLALSKLERNSQKDRDDVRFLARTVPFDLDILQERYATELRWHPGVPKRGDLTLQLWLDAIREDRGMAPLTGDMEGS